MLESLFIESSDRWRGMCLINPTNWQDCIHSPTTVISPRPSVKRRQPKSWIHARAGDKEELAVSVVVDTIWSEGVTLTSADGNA